MMNENMSSEKMIMPIGKYKGQPIEAIQHDKKYFDWLCQQSWFREKYGDTYQIIINNFQEPTETPEHNQLQAMFLKDEFKKLFMDYVLKKDIMRLCNSLKNELKYICLKRKEYKQVFSYTPINIKYDCDWDDLSSEKYNFRCEIRQKELNKIETNKQFFEDAINEIIYYIHNLKNKLFSSTNVKFEENGFDVKILYNLFVYEESPFDYYFEYKNGFKCRDVKISFNKQLLVEIKPNLSDDYPAILRQIKNNNSESGNKVLIYDKFSATGASVEEVKAIFASSGINVLSFADILGHEVL